MARYTIKPVAVGALARGKDYSVKDLGMGQGGYTEMVRKELGVSLNGDSPATRYVQLHELSHVQHSLYPPSQIAKHIRKKFKRDIPVLTVLAAEDARINTMLLRKVPNCLEGYVYAGNPLRQDIPGYVASYNTPNACREVIKKALVKSGRSEQVKAMDEVCLPLLKQARLTVTNTTIPIALAIADLLQQPEEKQEQEQEESKDSQGKGEGKGEPEDGDDDEKGSGEEDGSEEEEDNGGESESGESDEKADADAEEKGNGTGAGEDSDGEEGEEEEDEKELGKPSKARKHESHCAGHGQPADDESAVSGHPGWNIPRIVEPLLTIQQVKGNHTLQSVDTGVRVRPSMLHRISGDGMIFGRPRRKPGALQRGSVLIDVSGSMPWTTEGVAEVVERLPHSIVAIYSGDASGKAQITVVARNGRRVANIFGLGAHPDYSMKDNTCDGPALLWLSRQPGPRIWVCDGCVTGSKGNRVGKQYFDPECAAIMRAAGIVQVAPRESYEAKGPVATRTMVLTEAYHVSGKELAAQVLVGIQLVEKGLIQP
jgi:hypothetical protein